MHTLTGVVSLSTVPERLTRGLLEPTLRTLLAQTVVLPILVAVPWRSKRFPGEAYEVLKRPIKKQRDLLRSKKDLLRSKKRASTTSSAAISLVLGPKKQKRPIKKQKRPMKMPIENAKNHRAPVLLVVTNPTHL